MYESAYIKSIFADKSEITFSRRKHPSLKEFPNQQGNFFFGLPSSYCTPGDDKALRKKGVWGQAVVFEPETRINRTLTWDSCCPIKSLATEIIINSKEKL